MTRKLFAGAQQAKVNVDSAAKVIGYAGSTGGAAASAIGALRQFGLVDGLRGDVAVSELAMRILQPMNDREKVDALREAAMKPEIFDRIVSQFGGKLPVADDPIRSFLIRSEGFSAGGADELISVLRDTMSGLPEMGSDQRSGPSGESETEAVTTSVDTPPPQVAPTAPAIAASGELITLPLGQSCKAELRLIGDVTSSSYGRLIKHLELLREIAMEENGG